MKLTREELASEFRVNIRTVDNWIKHGTAPYAMTKIGRVVRFDTSLPRNARQSTRAKRQRR